MCVHNESKMRPLKEFPNKNLAQIKYVLTDIDDTLTIDGQLPAIAYDALERSSSRVV